VNGYSQTDQRQKLCLCVSEQVRSIHRNPPHLHHRSPAIYKVPLDMWLKSPTNQLIHWVSRIQHQVCISKTLRDNLELAQLSIRRFMTPLKDPEGVILAKFPP